MVYHEENSPSTTTANRRLGAAELYTTWLRKWLWQHNTVATYKAPVGVLLHLPVVLWTILPLALGFKRANIIIVQNCLFYYFHPYTYIFSEWYLDYKVPPEFEDFIMTCFGPFTWFPRATYQITAKVGHCIDLYMINPDHRWSTVVNDDH